MTEEEAKTKWCPFTRQPWSDNLPDQSAGLTAINRLGGKPAPGSLCLGRACMLWKTDTAQSAVRGQPCGSCGLAS